MNPIKHILVALDLSSIDNSLISYASFIAELLQVEKVFFVHNIKKYEFSSMLAEQVAHIDLDEVITDEITDQVNSQFTAKVDFEVLISEDPYTESLISYVVNKYSINLCILGHKNRIDGSGMVNSKLLRLLKCQILFIPLGAKMQLNTAMIATDFSNASLTAFSMLNLFSKYSSINAFAVHIYSLPLHFSPYLSSDKIEVKVEAHTQKKANKFKDRIPNSNVPIQLIPGRDANIAHVISKLASEKSIDLLIVSDKGSSTFSPFLVGGVTEELSNLKLNMPLLIVKNQIISNK